MKKTNKKGFTLVELLAVIVILAIVLIIAVPGVLTIIDNSRKDSLISTAKTIKDATRLYVTTSDSVNIATGSSVLIPLECIEADISENGFGKTIDQKKSYIKVTNTAGKFEYYAFLNSGSEAMTVSATKRIEKLTRADVNKDATSPADIATAPAADGTKISCTPPLTS